MPPLSIQAPYWTRPALLGTDRTFWVVLEHPPAETPDIALAGSDEEIPTWVTDADSSGTVAYRCTALGGRPGHTYDLRVRAGSQSTTMPGAVSVLPTDTGTLTLLHCSDLHLLKPTAEGAMEDRSALIAALIERINALNPDLVVCTGDLISRYDPQKRALGAEQIRWQIGQIRQLLTPLQAPLFVTLGNHDVAFEATRGDWYAVMGGGRNGRTDDYSLDWGRYHLVMMDCFAHYDPQNVLLENSFTPEQIEWLRQDLLASSEGRRCLVFAHYDYREHLPALFQEARPDLLFYGHAKALYPQVLDRHGIWDGHLADTQAYNLVHITPRGAASQTASWSSLASPNAPAEPGARAVDRITPAAAPAAARPSTQK